MLEFILRITKASSKAMLQFRKTSLSPFLFFLLAICISVFPSFTSYPNPAND